MGEKRAVVQFVGKFEGGALVKFDVLMCNKTLIGFASIKLRHMQVNLILKWFSMEYFL